MPRRTKIVVGEVIDKPSIFISYRRADSERVAVGLAGRLRDLLATDAVFLDHDDLEGGVSWREQLETAIAASAILICLIGDQWEGATTTARQIDSPDDPLRNEIALGLEKGVTVIPVLLDDAPVPTGLPRDIASLTDHQVIRLRTSDYESDFAELLRTIWTRWIESVDPSVVLLTVGSSPVDRDQFMEALTDSMPSAVRTLTLASTGPMSISLAKAREDVPALFALVVPEPLDDPGPIPEQVNSILRSNDWDKVVVAVGGAGVGLTLKELVTTRGFEWIENAFTGFEAVVEVVGTTTVTAALQAVSAGASGTGSSSASPSGGIVQRIKDAVQARPRFAGLLATGTLAAAAVAIVATSSGGEPASFRYGDLEFVAESPQIRSLPTNDPGANADSNPDPDHAFVEMTVANPGMNANAMRFFTMPVGDVFKLETADGAQLPAVAIVYPDGDSHRAWSLPGGSVTETFDVVFPVTEGQSVTGASLVVRVDNWTPLTVDLDGGPVEQPRTEIVVLNPIYEGPYGWGDNQASFTVHDAWASLEAGYDATGQLYPSTNSGTQRRAEDGFVFVHLEIEARQTDQASIVGFSNTGAHKGLADGKEYAGASNAPSQLGYEATHYHVTVAVPIDAADVSVGFYALPAGLADVRLFYEAELDPTFLDTFRSP